MFAVRLALCLLGFLVTRARCDLFLNQVGNSSWVFGNDIFNVTQGPVYATQVYYRGLELVGSAEGHYMGYGERVTPGDFLRAPAYAYSPQMARATLSGHRPLLFLEGKTTSI